MLDCGVRGSAEQVRSRLRTLPTPLVCQCSRSSQPRWASVGDCGDRCHADTGEWSYDCRMSDDVTLISIEEHESELVGARAQHGRRSRRAYHDATCRPLGSISTRSGLRFLVGEIELRGSCCASHAAIWTGLPVSRPRRPCRVGGGLRTMALRGGQLCDGNRVSGLPRGPCHTG